MEVPSYRKMDYKPMIYIYILMDELWSVIQSGRKTESRPGYVVKVQPDPGVS